MVKRVPNLNKPDVDTALKFAAEGDNSIPGAVSAGLPAGTVSAAEKTGRSGLIPEGHVRLNANVKKVLHTRIKIEAARQGKTIGDLIEDLIDQHIPR